MNIARLKEIAGRTYPARRRTQNLVGGASPIQATNFSMGYVTLEPRGGQVPWHNHAQEEVYCILEGTGEMCLGAERETTRSGERELQRCHADGQSATVIVTESCEACVSSAASAWMRTFGGTPGR